MLLIIYSAYSNTCSLIVLTSVAVPHYTVTSPNFMSNGLYSSESTFARKRRTTERENGQKSFGLGVNAFGRTFNLSLSPNKDLFAPNFKIEILRRNGTEVSKKSFEHCHFTGKVNGESGSAAVSACGGLVRFHNKL